MSNLLPRLQIFQLFIPLTLLIASTSHAVQQEFKPERYEAETTCIEEATPSPLYKEIEPYNKGFLQVSKRHKIYYEESGNPNGKPILFVHGGPGAGTSPNHRRFFDPEHYRIILFDQRGAGQSLPHAELRENTTWDLVEDMEKLRKQLGVEKWILFGGSWGSTLSLVYAETHPDRVRAMILRGIFLCRKSEIDWFYKSGAHQIYPKAWERFVSNIPENERGDLLGAYHKRMNSRNKAVRLKAAKEWSIWEGSASHLEPQSIAEIERVFGADKFALAFGRIETHYFINNIFGDTDNFILENAHKIADIPTEIVHGQFDFVCPYKNAYDLAPLLNNVNLTPTVAGHSADEPENTKALVKAADKFRSLD